MQSRQIRNLLKFLEENNIVTSEIANGGTDAGEWLILSNSPSCTGENLDTMKNEMADVLQLDNFSVENRGDGMVLRGRPRRTDDVIRDISYAGFFELIGKEVVSRRQFKIQYLSHFSAPFTGGGEIDIPPGIEFRLEQKMRFDAIYCDTSNVIIHDMAMRHERDAVDSRLKDRLSGVSFFLTKRDFEVGNVCELS